MPRDTDQDHPPAGEPAPPAEARRAGRHAPSRFAAGVLAVAVFVTAGVSTAAWVLNDRNEQRLLRLKVAETGTVLQVALPSLETPLASAAEIAVGSGGDVASVRAYLQGYVGRGAQPFVSASLWRINDGAPRLVASVGAAPKLAGDPTAVAPFFRRAAAAPRVSVLGLLTGTDRRLGYAYVPAGRSPQWAVYGESALPANPRISPKRGTPFSDLRFALYLGSSSHGDALLETNTASLGHRRASVVVPFGDETLMLTASPAGSLGGALSSSLWWVLAIGGGVLSLVAFVVAERLVRRRRTAEVLARQVQDLLSEQRGIAETLQHALLPQRLPDVDGLALAVRYLPGVDGVDIGGDWYDVIPLGGRRAFITIGDVSGRGVGAGAVMARLQFATRAFVSENPSPAYVLHGLSRLLNISRDGHFATVLCAVVDLDARELTIASAGHLPPLLLGGEEACLLTAPGGPPIGCTPGPAAYAEALVPLPPSGTLVAFTDGLVERRDESIDTGLARLRDCADGTSAVAALLDSLVDVLRTERRDDVAVLGLQWHGAAQPAHR